MAITQSYVFSLNFGVGAKTVYFFKPLAILGVIPFCSIVDVSFKAALYLYSLLLVSSSLESIYNNFESVSLRLSSLSLSSNFFMFLSVTSECG